MLVLLPVVGLLSVASALKGLIPQPHLFAGIAPHRIDLYKSRLLDPGTRKWRCLISGNEAVLNDDFCDCEDGSDEPGTSACGGIKAVRDQYEMYLDETIEKGLLPVMYSDGSVSASPFDKSRQSNLLANPGFYCPQAGFYPKYLPSWKINDMICDCCDGSDEAPADACPNTCAEDMRKFRVREELRRAEETELIALGIQRYTEGLALLKEWDDLMVKGPQMIEEAETELARLRQEKEANMTKTIDQNIGDTEVVPHETTEEEEEEWVEEWNEDGSIKRVKKERAAPPRQLLEEEEEEQQTLWSRSLRFLRSAIDAIKDTVHSVTSSTQGPPLIEPLHTRTYTPSPPYYDPVSVQSREVQSLKDKYNKAQSRINDPLFREFPQVVPWLDKSVSWHIGETTYSMALLGSAYSRQNWEEKIDLGTFTKIVPVSEYQSLEKPWMEASIGRGVFAPWALLYENGAVCRRSNSEEGQERIQSLVYIVCKKEDELLVWEEQETCRWTATLGSPAFCNILTSEQKHPTVSAHRDEL